MTGLPLGDDLYREIVLEHHRRPRHRGLPGDGSVTAEGVNPLCGDEVRVGIVLGDDATLREYGFDGSGCAISQASASLLGESVIGKSATEARAIIEGFESLVRGEGMPEVDIGDLIALEGVARFPMRVKCATLAAKTLEQALGEAEELAEQRTHRA